MSLFGIRVRAAHELGVALGIVPEHLFHERLGIHRLPARPQALGDADDPRGDRVGALRGHTAIASCFTRSAVPAAPKSRSSSSTNPRRPAPTVTIASTVPASVIASA